MDTKGIRLVSSVIILSITLALFPYPAQAQQPELPPVPCVEGVELPLSYGEHTISCDIGFPTDTDRFSFFGSAGDKIRVIVVDNIFLIAVLEIYDPNGTRIVSTTNPSVDITLTLTGTYTIDIFDFGFDATAGYTLALEKIPPVFTPPGITYGAPALSDLIGYETDVDFFTLNGEAGSTIRVIVVDNIFLIAVLEIYDPNGTRIVSTTNPSVDITLTLTGTYTIAIFDFGFDATAGYNISAICLLGPCPPPPPQPDVEGIVRLKGEPLAGKKVILKQRLEPNQTTTTDGHGYYKFDNAIPGKTFKVIISGPVVP